MNFEALAKDLLLVKQYRVEVYQQKKSRTGSSWTLAFKVSLVWYCFAFDLSIVLPKQLGLILNYLHVCSLLHGLLKCESFNFANNNVK